MNWSMANLFTPASPATKQEPTQQPANQPNANGQQPQSNGAMNKEGGMPSDPNASNGNNTQQQPKADPMDAFSKMWDNPTTEADKAPSFSIDPKVMDSVVSSQDFFKGAPQELVQKAQAGDMNSIMELMQHGMRSVYRNSLEHGGILTDKFVGAREAHGAKNLGKNVRQELVTNELGANTPNFKHPAVRQHLTEIATRIQTQNPDASPQEVAAKAKEYLTLLNQQLNPDSNSSSGKAAKEGEPQQTDWDAYWDADQQQ